MKAKEEVTPIFLPIRNYLQKFIKCISQINVSTLAEISFTDLKRKLCHTEWLITSIWDIWDGIIASAIQLDLKFHPL